MSSRPVKAVVAREEDSAARRRRQMFDEIREGLSRTPRELPSKYFYDERGSKLFEEITQLPEYYLTRAEREILTARAPEIVSETLPRSLVELGAGSAIKTRILLSAMQARVSSVVYVPVDVSDEFLQQTGDALREEYPSLDVVPVVADISETLDVPSGIPQPALFALLGSTIGNFDWPSAVSLLRRVRSQMSQGDRFLLGTDLRKDVAVIEAAYNDRANVTADFNRNVLRVVNDTLGADFEPERFAHRAIYDREHDRIEMYLDATGAQTVRIPGMEPIELEDGESIRTELSHKYDREAVDALAASARMRVGSWYTDSLNRFALSVLEPTA